MIFFVGISIDIWQFSSSDFDENGYLLLILIVENYNGDILSIPTINNF
jgi:hypothetical protein